MRACDNTLTGAALRHAKLIGNGKRASVQRSPGVRGRECDRLAIRRGIRPPVEPALRKLPKDILEAGPSHLPLPTERGRAVAQKLRVKRMGHPRVYLFMNN